MEQERLDRAIAAIDARNAGDPHRIVARGAERPKEQAHAEMVYEWIGRLRPDAGDALLLAARAHHVRRWTIPRESYGAGRVPYLQWRNALKDVHAAELRAAMTGAGYAESETARAEAILRRRDVTRDPDQQSLEDAICLVFLETQLSDVAARLDRAKLIDVLRKTARKMSARGLALAADACATEADRELLREALG